MHNVLADYLNRFLQTREKSWQGDGTVSVEMLFGALGKGHVCVDESVDAGFAKIIPALKKMKRVVGAPGDFTPLVLENDRLYFARYWKYEKDAADRLKLLATPVQPFPPAADLKKVIDSLFPGERDKDQAAAVAGACTRRLAVIAGGPGTGKTTTVAKILAAKQMLQSEGKPLVIKLAAYTGKAADRLRQSIALAKSELALTPEIAKLIPEEASTIHRLLGMSGAGRPPRRNESNTLGLDLLVLDEASMIDLSMLAKILYALPEHASLILLGDKDQLHAVQPGSVFGDLCLSGGALSESLFMLTKSFRFKSGSGIGLLSKSVNSGESEEAMKILRNDPSHEIAWQESSTPGDDPQLRQAVLEWLEPYFRLIKEKKSEREIFEAFNRFRVLTPLRHGIGDVVSMNAKILGWVRQEYLAGDQAEWYAGKPVMITENNYALELYNGDVGITLDEGDGNHAVVFSGEGESWRRFSPGRLPAYEPAFASTVHKCQGSEFDTVLLIIPAGDSPVMTRNLLYTGITRAKKRCSIWGSEESIRSAIGRIALKASGLGERLERGEVR